jgi:hypothetical protein
VVKATVAALELLRDKTLMLEMRGMTVEKTS